MKTLAPWVHKNFYLLFCVLVAKATPHTVSPFDQISIFLELNLILYSDKNWHLNAFMVE